MRGLARRSMLGVPPFIASGSIPEPLNFSQTKEVPKMGTKNAIWAGLISLVQVGTKGAYVALAGLASITFVDVGGQLISITGLFNGLATGDPVVLAAVQIVILAGLHQWGIVALQAVFDYFKGMQTAAGEETIINAWLGPRIRL